MNISENLNKLNQQIRELERLNHRNAHSVKLVAVSKKQGITAILEAIQAGQRAFGENYVQEALIKIEALKNYPLEWHFIGHVQSNKTKLIAEHFDWVHSVCSLKIAKSLGEARSTLKPALNICIQVNVSNENSKSGVHWSELPFLAQEIQKIPGIHLRGLMCIPEPEANPEKQRQTFHQLRRALDELNQDTFNLDSLSMGMSLDFPAAITEGATLIRLGTAIFGQRAQAEQ